MKSSKNIEPNELYDLWLVKFFNKTHKDVINELGEDVCKTPKWFDYYRVTQEQHDEWVLDAKKLIKTKMKWSNRMIEHDWPWIYLDFSPNIIIKDKCE